MKRALFLILLLSIVAVAQDVPPPQLDDNQIIANLTRQVHTYERWVVALRQRIQELSADNAALKMQLEELRPKEEGK